MSSVVLVLHLLVAISLVFVVLMQRSEGGALGIGGGSNSLISGRGAADMLAKITGGLAVAFFVTSISLTLLAGGAHIKGSVIDEPSRPGWFENLFPKKPDAVVTAPAPKPAESVPFEAAPLTPPAGDVAPAPADAIQRAGPIDSTPLKLTPTPAPKPLTATAPATKPADTTTKVVKVTPPAATATPAGATKPAKPAVGATKPAPAPTAESGEPAAPAGRAGPDE